MAYALVGSRGAVSGPGSANTAVTPAYGQTPTANNLLILFVSASGSTTLPATPTGWSQAVNVNTSSRGAALFYKIAAGGDAQPTIAAATSMIWAAALAEFSGNATASPLDQTGNAQNVSVSPGTATLGAADVASGELIVYSGLCASVAVTQNMAATASSVNFTPSSTQEQQNNSTSTGHHYLYGYGFTTANASADKVAVQFTSTSQNLTVVAATFLLAGGAPALPPELVMAPSHR